MLIFNEGAALEATRAIMVQFPYKNSQLLTGRSRTETLNLTAKKLVDKKSLIDLNFLPDPKPAGNSFSVPLYVHSPIKNNKFSLKDVMIRSCGPIQPVEYSVTPCPHVVVVTGLSATTTMGCRDGYGTSFEYIVAPSAVRLNMQVPAVGKNFIILLENTHLIVYFWYKKNPPEPSNLM